MNKAGNIISLFVVILLVLSCAPGEKQNTAEYVASIEQWHQLRIDSLKGKTGYLNLAGLFWLKPGKNTLGSQASNDFVFPEKALDNLGSLFLRSDSVWFTPSNSELISVTGGIPDDSVLVYHEGAKKKSMKQGDLSWFIIKRGTTYGVRLKDYQHPLLASFNHIDNYPVDAKWKVKAKWEEYPEPKMVQIKNQVGMDLTVQVPGAFHFDIQGDEFTLEPVGSAENATYFTMIYDETSGQTTYGSGRYINVPRPGKDGYTFIDFNKAYNPPCAFTEFATCTFPHAANRLSIKVEAGEKYSGAH